MSMEIKETNEVNSGTVCDIPSTHLEGLDTEKLEKMNPLAAAFEAGKHYFSKDVENCKGTLDAYLELDKNGNAERFAKSYSDYVNMPRVMLSRDPNMYAFMRDRVFYGKEYQHETKSNAFGMTFPMSPAEAKEHRKMVLERDGISSGRQSQDLLSNKLNYRDPEAYGGDLGRRGDKKEIGKKVLW